MNETAPMPQDPTRGRRHGAGPGTSIVVGIVLIALGIAFFLERAGVVFLTGNWWAIFIYIAAAGSFVNMWRQWRTAGWFDSKAASSLTGGLVLATVATIALFFEPAKLSLIPALVSDDELMAANSLDNASSAVSELVGLAFAGAAVALLGYARAFQLDALPDRQVDRAPAAEGEAARSALVRAATRLRAAGLSAGAQVLHRYVCQGLIDRPSGLDFVALNCQFFKYRDVQDQWRLVWCYGFEPMEERPGKTLKGSSSGGEKRF